MKGQFPLDIKKIKEEDRRFLLNRFLTKTIASHQGSMYNTTITLSLLALALSGFSVAYLFQVYWVIFIYFIFALIGLGWYIIRKYNKNQRNLQQERSIIGIYHDELFKYHFDYAKKNITNN